ncbi:MAG: hypothetical protein Q4P66_03055 [Actinomycetaceae bacterium]|nr:hypothetical protein [Actinomycetaceae bacterium]
MSIFNFDRLLLRRLRREPTHALDQARYLSVTTGRMEPYLRQLAVTPLFAYRTQKPFPSMRTPHTTPMTLSYDSAPHEPVSTLYGTFHNNLLFLHAYTTQLRLECDLHHLLRPHTDMRTRGGFDSSLEFEGTFERARILPIAPGKLHTTVSSDYGGVRIDAHSDNELTIERHHLTIVDDLCRYTPIVQAFTAVGTEELVATSPDAPDSTDITLQQVLCAMSSQLKPVPNFLGLLRCNVELKGFGGRVWPVYFVTTHCGPSYQRHDFPDLPESIYRTLSCSVPNAVIVNPGHSSWQRDILWEYRNEATPVAQY